MRILYQSLVDDPEKRFRTPTAFDVEAVMTSDTWLCNYWRTLRDLLSAGFLIVVLLLPTFAGCNGITITPSGIFINPSPASTKKVVPADDKITSHEFRFLCIEDASDTGRRKLTPTQLRIITGAEVRKFLNEHCIKSTDGTPERRFVDYHDDLTGEWKQLRDKYPPKSYPWLIFSNGSQGCGIACPSGDDAWQIVKPLFDKYAGVAD